MRVRQADWYRPNVKLDYPRGGVGSLIDALVRGVTKRGGKVQHHSLLTPLPLPRVTGPVGAGTLVPDRHPLPRNPTSPPILG